MSNSRLEPVYEVLRSNNLDCIAFVPGANFRRLMGSDFHLMERPLVVIVQSHGEPIAIVPNLELESFEKTKFTGLVFDWRDQVGYSEAFKLAAEAAQNLKSAERFGLEAQRMRVFEQMALAKAFPDANFVDAHTELSLIRIKKTADEISSLRKAVEISEIALEATLQQIKIGQTETEIQSILLQQLFANGADGLAFEPIVAAGANAALPHATARDDYKIQKGDALLIDFGASHKEYKADITRTFFVYGVSAIDRAFYETVLAANEKGRSVSRAGVTAHSVDDAVQLSLESSQFAEFAFHKTGHGLGLDVHEAPQIMRGNQQTLESGMVFTIEPGLYRSGECGVRIEDNVLVTEDGIDCLTSFSRELRIVG